VEGNVMEYAVEYCIGNPRDPSVPVEDLVMVGESMADIESQFYKMAEGWGFTHLLSIRLVAVD
jgi:hypothetical protein